ncbi:MAG: hypothetical protein V3W44_09695 [Dehalococcoidales bacterium]
MDFLDQLNQDTSDIVRLSPESPKIKCTFVGSSITAFVAWDEANKEHIRAEVQAPDKARGVRSRSAVNVWDGERMRALEFSYRCGSAVRTALNEHRQTGADHTRAVVEIVYDGRFDYSASVVDELPVAQAELLEAAKLLDLTKLFSWAV